ncbi:MAG TPA: hypothetical protein DDY98_03270, partial [Ruminococcaceae bacterium]|nr:hypothetical protein [Oscillospiraceae bacterium]
MKEKVSVVVPAYNAEKTLEKCLLSLQAQDYTNIQVIVVVDGATDRTEEIAAAFSEKDARFSYVVQPNGGPSAARNHGMRLATGEYVACVDSDDYVDPDFLRTLVCAIGDGEVAVSGVLSETETGEELRRTHFSAGVFTGEELLDRMLLSDNEIGGFAWNKMYRRSFLQDNGLLFFEGKNLTFEDIDFS